MLATWTTEPIAFTSGLEGLPWEGLVASLAVRGLFGDWQCQLQHSPLGELGKLHCPLTASVSSSVRWGHESALFIGLSELEVNSHKALGAQLSARGSVSSRHKLQARPETQVKGDSSLPYSSLLTWETSAGHRYYCLAWVGPVGMDSGVPP